MILSQTELRAAVEQKSIVFDPALQEKQWGEASIDLRLGYEFTVFREDIDTQGLSISVARGINLVGSIDLWATKVLKSRDEVGHRETFKLAPGKFVLAETYEKITVPRDMIARVEGRSTYARMGLSMHQTAPWLQPGWTGKIILEIMNNGKITIELTPEVDQPLPNYLFPTNI